MKNLTILRGHGKGGVPEPFQSIVLSRGELWTIVGNTGSGKSRLIKDIEQLSDGDSVTGRHVLLDGAAVPIDCRQRESTRLVAHLGQNMRFVLDTTVEDFLTLHAQCREKAISPAAVLELANDITPEPVFASHNLNQLSGGQARALMIADIALVCDSPVVLIDEIENAGVDKEKAFLHLKNQDKLVLVVTHDPHTALMAHKRIVLHGGAVTAVVERSPQEAELYGELSLAYQQHQTYQSLLRKGAHLLLRLFYSTGTISVFCIREKSNSSIDWLSACQTRTSTCESAISGLDTRNICRNIWPDRMPFSRI